MIFLHRFNNERKAASRPSQSYGGQASRRSVRPWTAWAWAALLGAGAILPARGEPIRVVATTTLVGDIVRRVGGEAVALTVLVPPDADPHAWIPRPADATRMVRADLVFVNGLGLEQGMNSLLRMPEIAPKQVSVSEGIEPRRLYGACAHGCRAHAHAHGSGDPDPHVWFDPIRVRHWARRIEAALSRQRPEESAGFAARRAVLDEELSGLDAWIRKQTEALPEDRRVLVSDHELFGYFADRYGFRVAGAVIPALSSLAQASARDLARLHTRIRDENVRALFVSVHANPVVAERLAADTGIRVVRVYTGSLSAPDGPAGDYFAFMRTNVTRIIEALK